MRESLDAKARRLLAGGRLKVVEASPGGRVRASVVGDHGGYAVARDEEGLWSCDCPARVAWCSHVLARRGS